MAQTITRKTCPKCNKRNLSSWMYKNTLQTKCKTINCNYIPTKDVIKDVVSVSQESKDEFIDSQTLEFITPDNYRGLSKATLEFCRIKTAQIGSVLCTEYTFLNLDNTVTKKIGFRPSKAFKWENKTESTNMYMLDACQDFTKPIYIVEGGEDCASLWELGYQSCSIHSGSTVLENLNNDKEFLMKFPAVVLCIEDDKVGIEAKRLLKQSLQDDIVLKEVDLSPRKDINDWIRNDVLDLYPDIKEINNRLLNAKELVPDGIIFGDMISSEELRKPLPKGIYTGFNKLDSMIKGGCLPGDLWLWTAGVSVGKSTVIRRLCSNYRKLNLRVANIFVEESKQVSQLNYIAEELGYPIGEVLLDPTIIPQEKWDKAFNKLLNNNDLMFIDEKWERTTDNLLKTIKYLSKVKKYDIIILDHITAILNSSGVGRGGKVHDIDWFMEQLFNLCRSTGIRVHAISHLKRPSQPPYWDEGKRPSMYDLRGSGSLEGKPDVIIGLYRNMKNENQVDLLGLEVLKNRWFSTLGQADEYCYIKSTGRLD